MKKITLLVASLFLVGSVANASEIINISDEVYTIDTRFDENEPIQFSERGIEFFVFANGEFDFNTRPVDSQGQYYYKTAGRRSAEVSRQPANYGVRIEHDSFGRVRRIGNTFINYDFQDRVNRIGSVYMKYNRFALTNVGGLQIIYNRFGEIIDIIGSVKYSRNFGFTYGNHQGQYYNNPYNNEYQNTSDNQYYYYKKDGTKAQISDEKANDLQEKNEDK